MRKPSEKIFQNNIILAENIITDELNLQRESIRQAAETTTMSVEKEDRAGLLFVES
jgi:hypothetical protein